MTTNQQEPPEINQRLVETTLISWSWFLVVVKEVFGEGDVMLIPWENQMKMKQIPKDETLTRETN